MKSLKTGDTVKIISGSNKGKAAKIVQMKDGKAYLEGVGIVERHFKRSMLHPQGGKAEVHVGIDPSNLKLVESGKYEKKAEKTAKTSRKSTKKAEKTEKGAEK